MAAGVPAIRHECSSSVPVAAAAIFIALMVAGCAHTELPAQAATPAPVGTARLPLKIAVLADPTLTIHPPLGFYERLNPGTANTVRDALNADFDTVVVVTDRRSVGDADLLAIPTVDVNLAFDKTHQFLTVRGGHQTDKLTVAFLEQGSGKKIAELWSIKPFADDGPGIHGHAGSDYAMGVSVAVFPPVLLIEEPYIQKHDADRFNAGFGPTLVAMATDVAAQAVKDPAIKSLSARQKPKAAK